MPRKRKATLEAEAAAQPSVAATEPGPVALPRAMSEQDKAIAESREALKYQLPEGQRFFESPEGFIVAAESTQSQVLCRKANNGKGMYINPMR